MRIVSRVYRSTGRRWMNRVGWKDIAVTRTHKGCCTRLDTTRYAWAVHDLRTNTLWTGDVTNSGIILRYEKPVCSSGTWTTGVQRGVVVCSLFVERNFGFSEFSETQRTRRDDTRGMTNGGWTRITKFRCEYGDAETFVVRRWLVVSVVVSDRFGFRDHRGPSSNTRTGAVRTPRQKNSISS
jgi:hypothetical protein